MTAACRARDVLLLDISNEFLVVHTLDNNIGDAVLSIIIFDQFIGTGTGLTLLTVDERIGKTADVTGSYPYLRVHEDRTVNTNVIRALLNELLPPCRFYVILELDTQRTEVPCVCQTTVDIGTRIYETSCLREGYDLFHRLFRRHQESSSESSDSSFSSTTSTKDSVSSTKDSEAAVSVSADSVAAGASPASAPSPSASMRA